jgi:hypothetical protein
LDAKTATSTSDCVTAISSIKSALVVDIYTRIIGVNPSDLVVTLPGIDDANCNKNAAASVAIASDLVVTLTGIKDAV